jgi:hypothetical protein
MKRRECIINRSFKMFDELPPEILNGDLAFSYPYPLAHALGWTDDQIRDALKLYGEIGIEGSIAGVSFRWLIYKLNKTNLDIKLMPSGLIDIIKVICNDNLTLDGLEEMFGERVGNDLMELTNKYKLGIINIPE